MPTDSTRGKCEGGTPTTREVAYLGVPWEESFGYAQAVRTGDTIHVSGQMSHDQHGALVTPAPLVARAGPSTSRRWNGRFG